MESETQNTIQAKEQHLDNHILLVINSLPKDAFLNKSEKKKFRILSDVQIQLKNLKGL